MWHPVLWLGGGLDFGEDLFEVGFGCDGFFGLQIFFGFCCLGVA